jgi:hypothetical protein
MGAFKDASGAACEARCGTVVFESDDGAWPNGTAAGFGPEDWGFDSLRPSHELYPKKWIQKLAPFSLLA